MDRVQTGRGSHTKARGRQEKGRRSRSGTHNAAVARDKGGRGGQTTRAKATEQKQASCHHPAEQEPDLMHVPPGFGGTQAQKNSHARACSTGTTHSTKLRQKEKKNGCSPSRRDAVQRHARMEGRRAPSQASGLPFT